MVDRVNPCIFYICAGATCKKNIKNVTLAKCKHCAKYRGRKCSVKSETVKHRRYRDTLRHYE